MKTETIEYKEGSTVCEGFAAYDEKAKRPGVMIVPEWNGVSEYSKKRAQMLADLGYNAFVADIRARADVVVEKFRRNLLERVRLPEDLIEMRPEPALDTLAHCLDLPSLGAILVVLVPRPTKLRLRLCQLAVRRAKQLAPTLKGSVELNRCVREDAPQPVLGVPA